MSLHQMPMHLMAQRLSDAEATIEALLTGQIDAVIDSKSKTPVLLFKAQEALRDSEGRFRCLFDSGIIGVLVTSRAGLVLEANDTFLRLVGYSRSEFFGGAVSWMEMTPVEFHPMSFAAKESLLAGGSARPFEKEYVRKDGERVPVLVGIALLDDDRFLTVVTDLTARRLAERTAVALEEQLRQSQKMDAIGRLAGGVAHDFNNLLSVVLSYSDLLMVDLKKEDPIRADIEEIHRAGMRAADLTRQLLMFSRQQVVEPRVLDLNDLMSGMEKMLRRLVGEDVELTCIAGTALGHVRADPGSIEQVIMNLAINARDAMPVGGKLTMETSMMTLDEEYVGSHLGANPGTHVMLSVTDTGCGMDKTTVAHIFEPFFTTKDKGKGTGLGLSTVFGIVQQSGGTVWVYSELGIGTTFKIYLPTVDSVVSGEARPKASVTLRGSETILLVEDEEQVRDVARGILRRHGYTVIDAGNAGDAILLCERHGGAIDLLVSDVVMPGMSGPELAKRLLVSRPKLKVLCMSGYTDDAAVRHGVIDASLAYLQKPITVEALTRRVRQVLDSDLGGVAVLHARSSHAQKRPGSLLHFGSGLYLGCELACARGEPFGVRAREVKRESLCLEPTLTEPPKSVMSR